MRRLAQWSIAACAAAALQGCVVASAVNTAVDVATLPVKVASRGIDLATTSQAEADRNRGRELRRREERLGALQRDHERLTKRCSDGDRAACEKAHTVYTEIQLLLPTVPLERED